MPRTTAAATRDRMLDAAAAEILAVGYTSASLSSIAARLGVTKGALAYHFPSKSDMAYALLDHMVAVYAGLQQTIADAGLRGVRALVVSSANAGLYTRTDVRFAAATSLLLTPGTGGLTLPPLLSGLADVYADHLREAVEDGEVSADLDVVEAGEDLLTGALGQLIFMTRHPERQGNRPMRFTRRQLRAIGVEDADRLVDDVLASRIAVPARFDEPGFTAEG
ncbi:MAG: TetR/AcrR family transcriptional regulator [Microbacterium sp.]